MEMVTNSPFPDSDNLFRLLVTKSLAKSDSDWARRKENVNVLIIATVIPSSLGLRFCLSVDFTTAFLWPQLLHQWKQTFRNWISLLSADLSIAVFVPSQEVTAGRVTETLTLSTINTLFWNCWVHQGSM